MNKKLIGIAALSLIIVLFVGYYIGNKPTKTTVGTASLKVSAETLLQAFHENEEQANEKYLDKVIEVKGKVQEVMKQDNTYMLMVGSEASEGSVSCTLEANEESVAYGLTEGDEITIRGLCTGFLLDVVLIDCVLIKNSQ